MNLKNISFFYLADDWRRKGGVIVQSLVWPETS